MTVRNGDALDVVDRLAKDDQVWKLAETTHACAFDVLGPALGSCLNVIKGFG
jgi:hypothetical protein